MFKVGAPYSTTHALMRDFACHTIQLALLHCPKLLTVSEKKRIIPPFRDGGIRKWGRRKEFGEDSKFSYRMPLQMDFANYTLGRLIPDRSNYDFNDRRYKEVVANVYWRLDQLGYSSVNFEEIDKLISTQNYGHRSEENSNRIDRYGKKYSWIVFYEIYGFRNDKGLLKSKYYDERERPSDIDIDPSFPCQPSNVQIIMADWIGNRKRPLASWIDCGNQPDVMESLLLKKINGIPGPWVLLDGFIVQTDEQYCREVFGFPRGILIPQKYSQELINLFSKQKYGLHLPEIPSDYYTFSGEIPWCDTFPLNRVSNLEVRIGTHVKRIPKTEIIFFRDGKPLNDDEEMVVLEKLRTIAAGKKEKQEMLDFLEAERVTFLKNKKWSKIEEAITKTIPVLLPVRKNAWESYHSGVNPGRSVFVPAREIAEGINLSIRPPSWLMYDKEGNPAAISTEWGNLWKNGQTFCYLRKDILDQFLKRNRMAFLWAFWGAREIRIRSELTHKQKPKFKHWRKDFQRIYRYNNGRIIAGKASEYFEQ